MGGLDTKKYSVFECFTILRAAPVQRPNPGRREAVARGARSV